MRYVARWRLHVAVAAQNGEGATIGQLADRLGYRSEAAFSRAFKCVPSERQSRLAGHHLAELAGG